MLKVRPKINLCMCSELQHKPIGALILSLMYLHVSLHEYVPVSVFLVL